jgi:hypothetical protein
LQPPPLLDELATVLVAAALDAELLAAVPDVPVVALELLAAVLDPLVATGPDVVPLPVWGGAPPTPLDPPPAPPVSTTSPSRPVAQATSSSPAVNTTEGTVKPMVLMPTSRRHDRTL